MTRWIRFKGAGGIDFGSLDGDTIAVHRGDMFDAPSSTGETVALTEVEVLTPCAPSKMIGLWNNFHALAAKLELSEPEDPLYFIKAGNAFLPHGAQIRRPPGYDGRVIYEGELGVVIGRRCANVSETEAEACIFGYTCVNDVTAVDILNKDKSFPQWVRAKSFDTFGPFGPVVVSGLDPDGLVVKTILNGQERQSYPVADMVFGPRQLVSRISHDMTLLPGDLIACGTSLGAGSMKEPRNEVSIVIDGVGTLSNVFEQ